MTWSDIAMRCLLVAIAMFNVGLSISLMRQRDQVRRYQDVLRIIVLQAFAMRQWPFPMTRALGLRVTIDRVPAEELWEEYKRMGPNDMDR